jgi:Fe-S-cluster-containing dehydrogenase component/DMSO reductase anchor subunit
MTTTMTGLAVPRSEPHEGSKRRLPLLSVTALLEAQQTLTAVERFAEKHDQGDVPSQARYYRDLIPLERPVAGEQYAFEVDLDACTGCKACVSACHSLNGLDDAEVWRTVGLLHGGAESAPAAQTVTTACHHCVEPACMYGCPVGAYEKDALTGIVKHLDDQCFGCQYCTLMCPYDAPKYSAKRGIVRKCDMCSDRLEHDEAPACVQACPNEAIAIRVVSVFDVVQRSDAQRFLPGAPAPDHTLPATVYKTERSMPANMLPADFYRTSPEHSHPPLVVMLTLTQLSAGAFVMACLVERLSGRPAGSPLAQTIFATTLALVALGASVLHLGRPWLAWRAVLGFRTSWLSREAVAFGAFAQLAVSYGVLAAAPLVPDFAGKSRLLAMAPFIQLLAAIAGMVGVFCSVMVYVATKRAQWSATQTGLKFFGSTLLLGAATVLAVAAVTGGANALHRIVPLVFLVMAVSFVKTTFEASVLRHYDDPRQSIWKRMAIVMRDDLRAQTSLRFALALFGGLFLPALLWLQRFEGRAAVTTTVLMFATLVAGEFFERYLFFRAAPASRMPGSIR